MPRCSSLRPVGSPVAVPVIAQLPCRLVAQVVLPIYLPSCSCCSPAQLPQFQLPLPQLPYPVLPAPYLVVTALPAAVALPRYPRFQFSYTCSSRLSSPVTFQLPAPVTRYVTQFTQLVTFTPVAQLRSRSRLRRLHSRSFCARFDALVTVTFTRTCWFG